MLQEKIKHKIRITLQETTVLKEHSLKETILKVEAVLLEKTTLKDLNHKEVMITLLEVTTEESRNKCK
jgi:hypothetical protein